MKNTAYIGLGSNKGDKLDFLRKAVKKINTDEKCRVELSSSLYETKPLGNRKQENYLNAVLKILTEYSVIELFSFLKGIEKELGRNETERWGNREIDMDILFYNDLVYSDSIITIPHKGIANRDFVLVPLCEIDSSLIHPELKQKICDINVADSEKCIIRKLPDKLETEEN
ncbi:MAG: 2-amino-4-hydroxy-6-hydroxymethyldihydropteridine diphosphokinase [Ignavibacteria bacterium GWA2_35_9]|nr:MAG: 2-amino-4-hydroxy-6-hydroxymethyldihydropteridine diphosphokinase [Ignavibacteria bacterium GWA2_35_9]OGU45728.1 MAG: 2-amino-4-hydroxy-6-hydroxymethyldihydropteridine diphosphokinase [Ignavibacteria bacterium GWB2_36_8]OGU51421.1 MAG: 2-amino-4-hydroxy-6-hydroxymethyldihydropteridine diphosphokinase [Ignavibacteria bacterium GWC2_36_12]